MAGIENMADGPATEIGTIGAVVTSVAPEQGKGPVNIIVDTPGAPVESIPSAPAITIKTSEPGSKNVELPPSRPVSILSRIFGGGSQPTQIDQNQGPDDPAVLLARLAGQGSPPNGGDNGDGGRGGDNGGPEQGGQPETRRWRKEDIWTPEFRAWGIELATEIINIRAKPYKERYKDGRFKELTKEWKKFCALKRRRNDTREPFKTFDFRPFQVTRSSEDIQTTTQTVKEKPAERDTLEGLQAVDQLLITYNNLREDPNTKPEQRAEVEKQLSRYFKEARRAGLLGSLDSRLGSLYVTMMEGLSRQPPNIDAIWKAIYEAEELTERTGKDILNAKRRSNPQSANFSKLEGVSKVYFSLAKDRLILLLEGAGTEETPKGTGVVGAPTIDGEFIFKISDLTFGTESRENLKQLLKTDDQLQAMSESDDAIWRFVKGNEMEFDRLKGNRKEALSLMVAERDRTYRQLVTERKEAIKNLAPDREAYREMAEDRELFWTPTYANYYQVSARTPEQFQTAVDTFTQWLRSGLTKSPNELFQRVSGFKDALTTAGQRERANVTNDFMVGLRQELEAMIAILGADFANEHYQAENYQQFLQFGAQDEGPARLVRLGRVGKGRVASVLHKFDKDPRFEMLLSLYGSRGEFMEARNASEMDRLAEHILDILIAETIGVEVKSYDPRDSNKTTSNEWQERDAKSLEESLNQRVAAGSISEEDRKKVSETIKDLRSRNSFEANLDELVKYSSSDDEVFKDLFDGFDQKDQDRIYAELSLKQAVVSRAQHIQRIIEEVNARGEDHQPYVGFEDFQLYQQFRNGQIPTLNPAEQALLTRLDRAQRIQKHLREGRSPGELSVADRDMYEVARSAVTLAWEMYGALGDKGRKGGGAFIVDRNHHVDQFNKLNYIPDDQLTEDQWKSIRFASILTQRRTKPEYMEKLGELLTQLHNGRKRVEELREEELRMYQDDLFYKEFKDKGDFKDYIPTHEAQSYIQFGENWIKTTYGGKLEDELRERLRFERRPYGEALLRNSSLTEKERRAIEGWMNPRGIDAVELRDRVTQIRKFGLWGLKKDGLETQHFDFALTQNGKVVDLETFLGINNFGEPLFRNCIGFDKHGNPVTLTFDSEGRADIKATDKNGILIEVDYDEGTGKPELYNQPESLPHTVRSGISEHGDISLERDQILAWDKDQKLEYRRTRKRISFDNLTKDTKANRMLLKRPLEIIDPQTNKRRVARADDVIGYNQDGQEVKLSFDQNGQLEGVDFDQNGKVIVFDKPTEGKRIEYDSLNRDTRVRIKEVVKDDERYTVFVEEVPADFATAINHVLSRSTRHMYWGYQEQDTGFLLTEESFAGARRIRDGVSRPEDEEPHATYLSTVDPTLDRVAIFPHEEGREDQVTRAAAEESYQSDSRIDVQLHETFYPANGKNRFNRIAMGLQDFGGTTKMLYNHRTYATRWPDMEVRRLRNNTPRLRLRYTSLSKTYGAGSLLETLRMMNYQDYKVIGLFALEKWIAQIGSAQDVFESLYGYTNPQEKKDIEGLGKKPTNDADQYLDKMRKKLLALDNRMRKEDEMIDEEIETEFLKEIRESLGRFEKYLARVHVLETGKRGERAPQWLEGKEIWERNPDGSIKEIDGKKVFNEDIDDDRNVGTAYHTSSLIFWSFVNWLRSDKSGNGQALYPTEALFYEVMDQITIASRRAVKEGRPDAKPQTRWEWLHGKINQP